ncbi:fatty acid hydroxylase [Catenovulum agarivorans DS-2]|uniref:Fatty acid hydroxylase n=1 Tax=Catenovulum agarivorans DS-2 TaxID=1328313 RepID=W7QJR4_9ALTE|nr:sterol desaturase family protein [Catenovulum agarivorans]EWH12121.1 fatty acid hydroxylase [Catenovulum agarivorans DS-2]
MLDWLQTNLLELASNITDANKRVFVVYLASSCAIAICVYALNHNTRQKKGLYQYLFNKTIWLHPSALADYQLMFINKFIKVLLISPFLFAAAPLAIEIYLFINQTFALSSRPVVGSQSALWVFTLVLFLLDDFSRFLLHWLMHKIPLLWRFHQVHHSAEVLTPLTIYRSHPIENLLYAIRMTLTQALALGICMCLYGPFLTMLDILGANVFVFVFNIFGANLRHSHVWWSWGKLEHILISPAQHQLHHAKQKQYYDCNFGTALAIWDKLFASLIVTSKKRPFKLTFGIQSKQAKPHNLLNLYLAPFMFNLAKFTATLTNNKKSIHLENSKQNNT